MMIRSLELDFLGATAPSVLGAALFAFCAILSSFLRVGQLSGNQSVFHQRNRANYELHSDA